MCHFLILEIVHYLKNYSNFVPINRIIMNRNKIKDFDFFYYYNNHLKSIIYIFNNKSTLLL